MYFGWGWALFLFFYHSKSDILIEVILIRQKKKKKINLNPTRSYFKSAFILSSNTFTFPLTAHPSVVKMLPKKRRRKGVLYLWFVKTLHGLFMRNQPQNIVNFDPPGQQVNLFQVHGNRPDYIFCEFCLYREI